MCDTRITRWFTTMREPSSITLKSDTRRTDKRKTKRPKAGQGTLVTKLKLTRRFLISVTAAGRTEFYQQAILSFFWFRSLQSYRNTAKLCFILWNRIWRNWELLLSIEAVRPVIGTKNCNDADISRWNYFCDFKIKSILLRHYVRTTTGNKSE